MQKIVYFCVVKRMIKFISFVLGTLSLGTLSLCTSPAFGQSIDDIILDIYNAATELGETDYEQLQTDLYALLDAPIDLNHTSEEELSLLRFLSPRQIDDILLYAEKHPFVSLYELRMIPSLTDYEIRDLLPFVRIGSQSDTSSLPVKEGPGLGLSPREVFAHAKHEVLTRVDARNIEQFEGSDPMYIQTRYRFDYQRRVTAGIQLRRPAGGTAGDLQYGAYIRLRDIGHLHSLVAGNFQASFAQGLVFAPVFHSGKSAYIRSVGQSAEGLWHYSSVDGEGLHGIGATLRWEWNKTTRLDVSALYSMTRANDSVWHHLIGANLTLRHKQLQVELNIAENIWSDSIRPYRDAAYNARYFRGRNQAVLGASVRYNHGWFDLFGEVATSQNHQSSIINHQLRVAHWGFGIIAGSRFYPASGVTLIALYRYYSPFFDNALGYAFSETSRLGDENGGYLGLEISRWKNWRLSGYADVFRFSGPKYGIPAFPTIGYDAMLEAQYLWSRHPSLQGGDGGRLIFRLRARQKGGLSTYSTRFQFNWSSGALSLRTTAEANLTPPAQSSVSDPPSSITYGLTLYQDLSFDLSPYTVHYTPLSLKLRLQGFDAREWNNRIYCYEHDVLYAFSIPAVYGLGGRAYVCLKWQIIRQLALYFRLSETIYARDWYVAKHPAFLVEPGSKLPTRTDIHLLLRANL